VKRVPRIPPVRESARNIPVWCGFFVTESKTGRRVPLRKDCRADLRKHPRTPDVSPDVNAGHAGTAANAKRSGDMRRGHERINVLTCGNIEERRSR
jgi:hypothetical protein